VAPIARENFSLMHIVKPLSAGSGTPFPGDACMAVPISLLPVPDETPPCAGRQGI
jgi:hypothetical protein